MERDRLYSLFGLNSGASIEEVKEAYQNARKELYPGYYSKDPQVQRKAQEKLREIYGAYKKLVSADGLRTDPVDNEISEIIPAEEPDGSTIDAAPESSAGVELPQCPSPSVGFDHERSDDSVFMTAVDPSEGLPEDGRDDGRAVDGAQTSTDTADVARATNHSERDALRTQKKKPFVKTAVVLAYTGLVASLAIFTHTQVSQPEIKPKDLVALPKTQPAAVHQAQISDPILKPSVPPPSRVAEEPAKKSLRTDPSSRKQLPVVSRTRRTDGEAYVQRRAIKHSVRKGTTVQNLHLRTGKTKTGGGNLLRRDSALPVLPASSYREKQSFSPTGKPVSEPAHQISASAKGITKERPGSMPERRYKTNTYVVPDNGRSRESRLETVKNWENSLQKSAGGLRLR